jgi:putative mRNA 3-end processing factor
MLTLTDRGLYCAAGDFFIDPWRPVDRAIVTHAHGDHLTWGCGDYLVADRGLALARTRLGAHGERARGIPYRETRLINGVSVSLHPAGHILGSAQIRLEASGQVWVVSGDYKTQADSTCDPFEPVRCHTFITESTFGLPIYQWAPQHEVFSEINAWWQRNAESGRASLLYGYSLGKAQRLLSGLDASIGPIVAHGAVETMVAHYREAGVSLPPTVAATALDQQAIRRSIALAPPNVDGSPWTKRFGDAATAFASGWMRVRGARRWRSLDRGFTLSDHVDWPSLLQAIDATGASRVWVTHGFTAPVVRWLTERGLEAQVLPTRYSGEREDAPDTVEPEA